MTRKPSLYVSNEDSIQRTCQFQAYWRALGHKELEALEGLHTCKMYTAVYLIQRKPTTRATIKTDLQLHGAQRRHSWHLGRSILLCAGSLVLSRICGTSRANSDTVESANPLNSKCPLSKVHIQAPPSGRQCCSKSQTRDGKLSNHFKGYLEL